MNLTQDLQEKIRNYLEAVAAAAEVAGRSDAAQRELLRDLEAHIHEALRAKGGDAPTPEHLAVVLAEMDPPEAFAAGDSPEAGAGVGTNPGATGSGGVRSGWFFLLGFAFLLLNGAWYWQWKQGRVTTDVVTASLVAPADPGNLDGAQALEWVFSAPMAADAECGQPLKDAPARILPDVPGRWTWRKPNRLVFQPAKNWPLCTEYAVVFGNDLFSPAGRPVRTPQALRFRTEPLRFMGARQVGFQSNYGTHEVTVELEFNAPPDLASLRQNLTVTGIWAAGQVFPPLSQEELMNSAGSAKVLLRQNWGERLPEALNLKIGKGVAPSSGTLGLREGVVAKVEIKGTFALTRSGARSPSFGPCELLLDFTEKPDAATAAAAIEIKPEVKFSVVPTESYFWCEESYYNGLRLSGDFEPGRVYEVTVRPALRSRAGTALARPVTRQVQFPERKPSLTVTREGRYLPPGGSLNVPLAAVSLPDCTVTLRPVLPQNLVFLALREGGNGDHDSGAAEALTGAVLRQTYDVAGRENEIRKFNVNLATLCAGRSPRGIWLLRAEPGPHAMASMKRPPEAVSRLLVVSDLGLSVKSDAAGALVWVTSLPTAQPVAGAQVTLYASNNTELARGVTGADGLVRLPFKLPTESEATPFLVTAAAGDELSFLPLSGTGVSFSPGVEGRPYLQGEGCEAFVFTARGIFRPGETLQAKALVRNARLEAPAPFPAVFRIRKPDGKVFRDLPVTVDAAGAAECSLELPAYLPTGRYDVRLVMPGTFTELGGTAIRLEDFVPPQILVALEKLPVRAAADKDFSFAVSAHHLFGATAAGLPVEARAVLEPVDFKAAGFPGYRFRDATKAYAGSRRDLGKGTLNADGRGEFKFPAVGAVQPPSALQALVEAVVVEPGGRPVAAAATIPVDAYPYYLGLKTTRDGGVVRTGEEMAVQVAAVRPDGVQAQPATNQLKAEIRRVTWNTVMRRTEDGGWTWESEKILSPAGEGTVTLAGGAGEFRFTPAQAGEYVVILRDPFCGVSASVEIQAAAPEQSWVSWAREKPDRVELTLDRKGYHPGETARLLIKAPFSGLALLTLESDRVLEARLVTLEKNTAEVELPVRAEFMPNVYAVISLVRPAVAEAVWSAHRAVGAVALPVEVSGHRLAVTLEAPAEIRPQSDLTVKLRTVAGEDPGRGVPAAVTLMAVDEGICRLTDFATPDPIRAFLAQRALAVGSHDLYSLLMPLLTEDQAVAAAHIGGDGGAGALMRRLNPVRASRFRPVALWRGAVVTGADGTGEATLHVPEFTGRLRLMAVAHDAVRTGSAETPVTVKRPLVVQPALPRFAAPGDRFQAELVIFNETGAKQEVRWRVACGGPLSAAKPEGLVTLDAGASATVPVELEAGKTPGKALCTVTVTAGAEKYEETLELPIRPAAAPVTQTFAGSLAGGAELTLPVPPELMPETPWWSVHASGQSILKLLRGLDFLLRYPYGCVEQTTSSAFPLLYLEDLVAYAKPRGLDRGETGPFIQAGILRLFSMQHADGGFGMWPGAAETANWAGTYAIHFLVEAKAAGNEVPAERLDAALNWLKMQLDAPVQNEAGASGWEEEMSRRAYACFVLARAGRPHLGWTARLRELAPDLRLDARIHIASALLHAGDPRAATALLKTVPLEAAAGALLRDGGGIPSSRIRDAALLLGAWVDVDPKNPAVPRLVASLEKFQNQGHWYTTQDDAMVLLALGKLARAVPADRNPFNGFLEAGGVTTRFNREQPLRWDSGRPGGAGALRLRNDGPGVCHYLVLAEGVPAGGAQEEGDFSGLKVRREFLDEQGNALKEPGCVAGDRLTVRLTVDTGGAELDNVVVCDLLPAGLEVENPAAPPAELKNAHDWVASRDVRDDRVLLFSRGMSGVRQYFYTVRAVTPGRFVLPALTAEAMYDPDVRSCRGRGEFEVRNRPKSK